MKNQATKELASFVSQLKYEALPESTVQAVKNCLLDYFGCALFATQTDMGKIIIDYCKCNNSGKASILPDFDGGFAPSFAALANGTCAHGFELDDINTPSISHPSSVVMPSVIALAEEYGYTGKQVITAIVAGYEVMSRVGSTIAAAHLAKGFHPTASFGTFGATAACANLLGLTTEQTEWAFGLAGSMASGLTQFSINGSMVKRIHGGKSAQQGIICAQLAQKGFTGPKEIFEGDLGFCKVFRDDSSEIRWERLTAGLGKSFVIENTTYKPSPSCGVLHASIECVSIIKRRMKLDPEKIEKIVVIGSQNLATAHNVYRPDSILAAQYSLPFSLAMEILGDLTDPRPYLSDFILTDPKVLSVADKVTTEFDPDDDRLYPAHFAGHVKIVFKDGSVAEEKIQDPLGSTYRPFTFEQLHEKYEKLASGVLDEVSVKKLADKISRFETLENTRNLIS
jgi:2-methylcitrate dehydratase PrpD